MNLLEHYIIEVQEITVLPTPDYLEGEFLKIKVFCDCWGCKDTVTHFTTRENWIREMKQGYFMA